MDRRTLAFIALAITMLYGAGFAVLDDDNRQTYAIIGAIVIALSWIAVGMLGKDDKTDRIDPAR